MKRYVIITADTNDADYVIKKTEIDKDFEEKYGELIEAIKNNSEENWICGDIANKNTRYSKVYSKKGFDIKLLENFSYYVPTGEYGCHTIESIEIIEVTNEEKLL